MIISRHSYRPEMSGKWGGEKGEHVPASYPTSLRSVPCISTGIPTKDRRNASLDDANSIFCLIFASSGDLIETDQHQQQLIRYITGTGSHRLSASPSIDIDIDDRIGHNIVRNAAVGWWYSPRDKAQLVPLPSPFFLEFKVIHSPFTLGFWKISQEVLVVV
jgi:hypothetical protein